MDSETNKDNKFSAAPQNCPKEANFPSLKRAANTALCSRRFLMRLVVGYSADQLRWNHASSYTSEAGVLLPVCH